MESLTGLNVFVRVVDTGGFSAAARDLGMSKSAVSKRIARLENHLGVRLLNRTTRRLSATEAGTVFYERASRIVADIEDAECAVSALHTETRGRLKVNVPMSFGVRHMAPALADFMRDYPDVSVDMSLNDRIVDLIDEGFDVAIRIAKLPDSSMIARRLAPFRHAVCATPDYWRSHGTPTHPNDLKNHNCLRYSYLSSGDEWRFRGPDGPISVKISGNFQSNNGDTIRAMSLGGHGVNLSPTFIVGDDLRAGRMRAVLTDFMDTDLAIYAVYPASRHLSAKVRAFVDFMADRFGPEPYWDKDCTSA
ncbi:MAG: LysR family transcriptional regulator [Alphaproteobacteria bacterium]